MDFDSPDHLTGSAALKLRKTLGIPQRVFWGEIGVPANTGSGYEHEHYAVPEPVRLLLFLRYVAGVPVTEPARIMALAKIEAGVTQAREALEEAERMLEASSDRLGKARQAAQSITTEG